MQGSYGRPPRTAITFGDSLRIARFRRDDRLSHDPARPFAV